MEVLQASSSCKHAKKCFYRRLQGPSAADDESSMRVVRCSLLQSSRGALSLGAQGASRKGSPRKDHAHCSLTPLATSCCKNPRPHMLGS